MCFFRNRIYTVFWQTCFNRKINACLIMSYLLSSCFLRGIFHVRFFLASFSSGSFLSRFLFRLRRRALLGFCLRGRFASSFFTLFEAGSDPEFFLLFFLYCPFTRKPYWSLPGLWCLHSGFPQQGITVLLSSLHL